MTILPGAETLFYATITVHTIISIVIIVLGWLHRTDRTRRMPILFGINLGIFLIGAFIGINYFEFTKILDLVSFLGYLIISCYVVAIEIPGYILLSRYDQRLADAMQNIRRQTISLNYDFGNLSTLQSTCQTNRTELESVSIYDILEEFVKRCTIIGNLDSQLYNLALKELGEQIKSVSERSKHPFPKLIEIMSLAGISFLLGQFLNHFFT